jgi:HSP20 family protein
MVFGYQSTRHPFHQLRNEVDRLLTGFLGPTADGFLPAVFRGQPPVNVWEQQDALKVEMELPGIKSEQLDISVAGNELSIKVNRPDAVQEGVTYHRRERPIGAFGRIVRLPVEVDADHVEADLHDGVLTITLPKAESAKPRKINVTGT